MPKTLPHFATYVEMSLGHIGLGGICPFRVIIISLNHGNMPTQKAERKGRTIATYLKENRYICKTLTINK